MSFVLPFWIALIVILSSASSTTSLFMSFGETQGMSPFRRITRIWTACHHP